MDDSPDVDETGLSDQYPKASPWPLFVALGLVLSEAGVLFGVPAVAVGGILLFAASVVGILRESGYADSLWGPSLALGVLFAALGAAAYLQATGNSPVAVGVRVRGLFVMVAGGLVAVAAVALWLYESERL